MIRATYNEDGAFTGFYREDLHSDIPEPNVELTEKQWSDHVSGKVIYHFIGGKVVAYVEPARPVYPSKAAARAAMAAWIDQLMAKITGQVPNYERASWPSKAEAARAFVAGTARSDQTAMIEAEAGTSNRTAEELANVIVARADAYEAVIAKAAGLRVKLDNAIEAETDPFKFKAILEDVKVQAIALAAELGIEVD
ncbi:hypothetical protein [Ruegeria arenilitoris]|uniref:hypothetical protein n=1 Tax=Ruegeria arenilitoris TaxID=1173585 RepID=UPI0014800F69|nr:hypothetical protein [Ruegeria arenilitoris]